MSIIKKRRRNKRLINKLKDIFKNKCQNCDYVFIKNNGKPLSYGCHIIAHSETQDDSPENVLILCALCHDILDKGSIDRQIELMNNVQNKFSNIEYKRRKEWKIKSP